MLSGYCIFFWVFVKKADAGVAAEIIRFTIIFANSTGGLGFLRVYNVTGNRTRGLTFERDGRYVYAMVMMFVHVYNPLNSI